MGIFKKKQDIVFEDNKEKTPVHFKRSSQTGLRTDDLAKKNKRKKIKRAIVWSLIFTILAVVGVFGYKAYKNLNSMFENGSGDVLSLISGNTTKQQLKGESRGRTNILLLGIGDKDHAGYTLSDTVILLSIDYKSKNIAMFSIPRDTYVNIPGYGYSKINGAHAFGEKEGEGKGFFCDN